MASGGLDNYHGNYGSARQRTECIDLEELMMYRQAVPLVHSQSTAAAKTLKKMIPRGSDVSKRIVARQGGRSIEGSHTVMLPSDSGKWAQRQLEFVAACEAMLRQFCALDEHNHGLLGLNRSRVSELLDAFELHVDPASYRQWEQILPEQSEIVSLRMLVQACRLWFGERFLIDHVNARLRDQTRNTKSKDEQLNDHPFNKMTRESEAAAGFNYREYASRPTVVHKEIATFSPDVAGNACNRRHKLSSCASAPTIPIGSCSSLPSRQINQPLAPVTSAAKDNEQKRRLRARLDTDMARAFSASVAMISRHVHNEDLRDTRDALEERQIARVDEQRHWNQVHRAHCRAIAEDRTKQHQQQVAAMKALAKEEQQLTNEFAALRQDLLRQSRLEQPFSLSASTSTMFQQPPEILAARATAKTQAEKKRLHFIEREHLDHMRSLQLLDYVFDKKRAILDAMKPRADAALINVGDSNDNELPMADAAARDDLWRELLQREADAGGDFAGFVPPPNSPPAALRYFGSNRPVALPPFASRVPRDLA